MMVTSWMEMGAVLIAQQSNLDISVKKALYAGCRRATLYVEMASWLEARTVTMATRMEEMDARLHALWSAGIPARV